MEEESVQRTVDLLAGAARGEAPAVEALLPVVYKELRALAGSFMRSDRAMHTLQPTALVHEAYLKLIGPGVNGARDRAHFMAIAGTAMRQIIIDHAERRRTAKRGGAWNRVPLTGLVGSGAEERVIDALDLDGVLRKLAELDERKARVVELRFFAGMSVPEVAEVLGTSVSTVEADWRFARSWLSRELNALQGDQSP